MVDCEIKGEKVGDGQAQVSPHLKPKHAFLVPKVPKKRGVIFCPPPFFWLFLRGEKWVSARCATLVSTLRNPTTSYFSSYLTTPIERFKLRVYFELLRHLCNNLPQSRLTSLNGSLVYNRRISSIGSFHWAFCQTIAQVKIISHLVDQYLSSPALIWLSFDSKKRQINCYFNFFVVWTPIVFLKVDFSPKGRFFVRECQ